MSEYQMGYVVGVALGVIVGLIVLAIVMKIKKKKGVGCEYDERQELARGKSFKAAFFTLMIYCFADGCLDVGLEQSWGDTFTQMMVGVLIAVTVFVTIAMKNDAYFSFTERPTRMMILFGIIAVVNIGIGIMNFRSGEIVEDGMVTFRATNMLVGIMFLIILVEFFVKVIYDKNRSGE